MPGSCTPSDDAAESAVCTHHGHTDKTEVEGDGCNMLNLMMMTIMMIMMMMVAVVMAVVTVMMMPIITVMIAIMMIITVTGLEELHLMIMMTSDCALSDTDDNYGGVNDDNCDDVGDARNQHPNGEKQTCFLASAERLPKECKGSISIVLQV